MYSSLRCTALGLAVAALIAAAPSMATEAQTAAATADELIARYDARTARVEVDANQQASGLFQLQGPLAIALQPKIKSLNAVAGTSAEQDTALALANQFFADNKALLAIADIDTDVQLSQRQQDRFGNQHLRFQRVLNGLPVSDMELLVHVDSAGVVTGVNGNIVRPSAALLSHMQNRREQTQAPVLLDSAQALSAVAQLRGVGSEQLRLLKAQLSLANEAPFIRWHLDLNPRSGIDRLSYWLDAETGELITVANTLRHPIAFPSPQR